MTATTTIMGEIQQLHAEQRELDAWLDSHALCDGHSPGARPGACARCLTLERWDGINRTLVRLLRYGGGA